jgi:hypothetical protein
MKNIILIYFYKNIIYFIIKCTLKEIDIPDVYSMFDVVVAIVFQNVFCLKMHWNNIYFLFLKLSIH